MSEAQVPSGNCRRTSKPHPSTLVSPSGQVSPSPRTGEPHFSLKSKGSFLPLLATPYVTPWLVISQGQSKSELNLRQGLSLSISDDTIYCEAKKPMSESQPSLWQGHSQSEGRRHMQGNAHPVEGMRASQVLAGTQLLLHPPDAYEVFEPQGSYNNGSC